jgi:hypothetical protein
MNSSVFGSVFSAFIIGAGSASVVGLLFSNGKANWQGMAGVVVAGAVAAAKDYRSSMRLPPVKTNGDTTPPFPVNKP